jgi:hypothetical protein
MRLAAFAVRASLGGVLARGALAAGAVLALSGCVSELGSKTLAAPAPVFDPAAFFQGRTEGTGTLHRVFSRPKTVVIESTGRSAEDRLMLTQRILIADEKPEMRTWQLRRVKPGRWIGTLTGSEKPVILQVRGNMLAVRYKLDPGLTVRQWLYLRPDGTVESRTLTMQMDLDVSRMEMTFKRL